MAGAAFQQFWLVVADLDLSKPWDGKITSSDVELDGKTIHVITC